MKKLLYYFSLTLLLQSCWYNGINDDDWGSSYNPVTMYRAEFEQTITITEIRPVVNSGKIYIKDDLIYLNEQNEGFHIIDNSDPSDPEPVAFLNIPLATDLAIRGNVIYVHHAVDLVAFTYSIDYEGLKIIHRERNVFPPLNCPDGFDASSFELPAGVVIVGYEPEI